jgi:hypothetical protein
MQQNEHNFQMAILREPTEVLADPTAEDFGEIGTYVNRFVRARCAMRGCS